MVMYVQLSQKALDDLSKIGAEPEKYGEPQRVSSFHDGMSQRRYKVLGLWFGEDELKHLTKEDYPELYL